ncbi:hypothetical protein [Streptomyces sp. 7N604]|uniref:hypothetical protein n=1 Tax=Streptomyces sp. 7N604 TaxID=3457415 RepID=UPI003FD273DB
MKPYYRPAVHRLLTEAYLRLTAHADGATPPLHDLFAQLVVELCDRDLLGDHPPSLGGTVDQAAACLLNLATPERPARFFDEDLPARLGELDRLPLPERLRLLEAATRHTGPAPEAQQLPAQRRTAGPCPCACTSGGFCGGCGHAGCGGRR